LQIESLKKEIENLKEKNSQDKAAYSAKINELQKMIDLLNAKSSDTEKKLIEENKELQKRCDEEKEKLREAADKEREKFLEEISSLKKFYEDKIASLKREIEGLNSEVAELKKLTEKHKRLF